MCSWRDRPPSPHVTRMGRDRLRRARSRTRGAIGRDPAGSLEAPDHKFVDASEVAGERTLKPARIH